MTCPSLSAHLMHVCYFGYCPCGWNGVPRSREEYERRKLVIVDRDPADETGAA